MSERITAPRGTTDILPDAVIRWQRLESTARQIMRCYGYQEIRTPIFEDTNLFARSLGQASDVVQKQMLNLAKNVSPSDKDSQREQGALTLRPEGTASIVRAYIEHHLARQESLSKLFYWGPMFRGERPQKGRLRQFHQVGVEVLGTQANSPYLDVEVIALAVELLKGFGLTEFKLKINSLGSAEDKEQFSTYLRERLGQHQDKLCADCQQRLERNVFRVLDCKNPSCRSVVQGLHLTDEHLAQESRAYFDKVKSLLNDLQISYEVSAQLVRGLDYYSHTVFEFSAEGLGSQDAVGAGGRYNSLVGQLGGDAKGEIGAVGFALGIERILLATEAKASSLAGQEPVLDAFLVVLDNDGEDKACGVGFSLLQALRAKGVAADMSFGRGSLKSQMRQADKSQARYVIIIGENELKTKTATVKNLSSGVQENINFDRLSTTIKKEE